MQQAPKKRYDAPTITADGNIVAVTLGGPNLPPFEGPMTQWLGADQL